MIKKFIKNFKIFPKRYAISYKCANGKKATSKFSCYLPLKNFGNLKFNIVEIADGKVPPLIGGDFLEKNEASLCYKSKTLNIGNKIWDFKLVEKLPVLKLDIS